MRKTIKVIIVMIILAIGLTAFFFSQKAKMQMLNPVKTPETILEGTSEVAGYKKWTKVNDKPRFMGSWVLAMCNMPTQGQIDNEAKNPHIQKYINVYVNSIGKEEMLTKKNPKFAVGTVVVKEKLASPESLAPELLTVMIKREKGFNPEVGDWEFMTLNGEASKVTSKGKLESCQTCHLDYKQNDYITRTYLPEDIQQKLK